MSDLDARFEHDMIETVYRASGRQTGYWASYFLRAVRQHGGVAAAKRLLSAKGLSKGLITLQEKGRLDLAMETLVLRPEYGSLFTEDERATAERRLQEVRTRNGAQPADVLAPDPPCCRRPRSWDRGVPVAGRPRFQPVGPGRYGVVGRDHLSQS